MPWMKREGAVLVGALCLAALAAGGFSRRARAGWGVVAGAAAAIAGPWWLSAARAGQASADFLPLGLDGLATHAGRLPTILRLALANLAGPDWAFVWPLALLLGLAGGLAGRGSASAAEGRRGLRVLPLAATFYLGSMSLAYIFSAYAPYQQHVLSSWHRLAAHVVALPLVWIAARPWALPAAQPGEDV
jgi:hypothetical protein